MLFAGSNFYLHVFAGFFIIYLLFFFCLGYDYND